MDRTREFIRQAQEGNQEAKEILLQENTGLIWNIVKRFYGRGYDPEDLYQIGAIGLLKCIDNFDFTYDVKFSTYAVPMILGEVRRYLRDNNSIRVSRSLRDTAYKAIYAKEQLTKSMNRTPTIEEVSKKTEIPEEDIIYALDAIATPMSLFEPVYQDGNDPLFLMDQICDKKNKEDTWIEHLSLQEAMNQLSGREYHIIEKRFFEGKTQTEIADEISISQAQVSRLEKNALKSIRNFIER